jgi:hypothetical protein
VLGNEFEDGLLKCCGEVAVVVAAVWVGVSWGWLRH